MFLNLQSLQALSKSLDCGSLGKNSSGPNLISHGAYYMPITLHTFFYIIPVAICTFIYSPPSSVFGDLHMHITSGGQSKLWGVCSFLPCGRSERTLGSLFFPILWESGCQAWQPFCLPSSPLALSSFYSRERRSSEMGNPIKGCFISHRWLNLCST